MKQKATVVWRKINTEKFHVCILNLTLRSDLSEKWYKQNMAKTRNIHKNVLENLKKRNQLGDLGMDGIIILKLKFEKQVVKM
jgi:hypothetical protein